LALAPDSRFPLKFFHPALGAARVFLQRFVFLVLFVVPRGRTSLADFPLGLGFRCAAMSARRSGTPVLALLAESCCQIRFWPPSSAHERARR
jgi:hypothetical protein